MSVVESSDKLKMIHSDIRGPVYQKALEMERQGIEVLKLNTGNPGNFGFGMPDSVRQALLANMDRAVAYCAPGGLDEAREALRAYHASCGLQGITAEDVFIGNGVSEMAQMVCASVLSAGDELLVPAPCYSLWSNSAYLAGAKPVYYICDEKADWYPDLDDMARKITPKTKAIVLINPNNPTGQVYAPALTEHVAALAREHGLLLISDESYDRLIMDDMPFRSAGAIAPDLPVVTLNGLSKSHIICGFRCGWAVVSGPREQTRQLRECLMKLSALRLCGNVLTQLVIPAAMNDPDSTRAMLIPGGRIYEQRSAALRALDQIDCVSYVKPHASFYIFPKISDRVPIRDDRQFAVDLLQAKHILLVPGSGFVWPAPDHFRLVLLPEPEELYRALLEIGDFLEHYRQD